MDKETRQMFNLILDKLDKLDGRLDKLESRMDKLESRMDKLEDGMDKLKDRVEKLEGRMDNLESRQDEIYQIVRAIDHANKVHRAEVDSLKNKNYYLEGTINGVADYLVSRKAANDK